MATIKDISGFIDSLFPFSSQEEWDNSGFLVGSPDTVVKTAALALDITDQIIDAAEKRGVQLIISHHPVIFKPQKSFLSGNPAFELARRGIGAVCVHTPADAGSGGVNDRLCDLLGIENARAVDIDGSGCAIIRVADISPVGERELAERIAAALGAHVRFTNRGRIIRRVALCGGAGCMFLKQLSETGADAFITGDAGHHDFLFAEEHGLSLFAAGHYETENPFMATLSAKLREQFPDVVFEELEQGPPCDSVAAVR